MLDNAKTWVEIWIYPRVCLRDYPPAYYELSAYYDLSACYDRAKGRKDYIITAKSSV